MNRGVRRVFETVFANYPDVLLWNARIGMVPDSPHGLLLSGGTDIGGEWLRQPVTLSNAV